MNLMMANRETIIWQHKLRLTIFGLDFDLLLSSNEKTYHQNRRNKTAQFHCKKHIYLQFFFDLLFVASIVKIKMQRQQETQTTHLVSMEKECFFNLASLCHQNRLLVVFNQAGQEFLQFASVDGKLPNAIGQFVGGHLILVHQPTETRLV